MTHAGYEASSPPSSPNPVGPILEDEVFQENLPLPPSYLVSSPAGLGGQGGAEKRDEAVRVCVRARPANEDGFGGPKLGISSSHNYIQNIDGSQTYHFDQVFDWNVGQEAIYESCVSSLVENFFMGYNATILAYGQVRQSKERSDELAMPSLATKTTHTRTSTQPTYPSVTTATIIIPRPNLFRDSLRSSQTGSGKTYTMGTEYDAVGGRSR